MMRPSRSPMAGKLASTFRDWDVQTVALKPPVWRTLARVIGLPSLSYSIDRFSAPKFMVWPRGTSAHSPSSRSGNGPGGTIPLKMLVHEVPICNEPSLSSPSHQTPCPDSCRYYPRPPSGAHLPVRSRL